MNAYVGLEQYIDWEDIGITKGIIEKGEKIPKATSRNWICKHLDHTVPNKEFFTDKVFTQEVLEKIEGRIKHVFNYNTEEREIDLEAILESDED
jgi:ATP-dependent phosphoenolpyruvate carboxykinase